LSAPKRDCFKAVPPEFLPSEGENNIFSKFNLYCLFIQNYYSIKLRNNRNKRKLRGILCYNLGLNY
jgi:hypothetical protein